MEEVHALDSRRIFKSRKAKKNKHQWHFQWKRLYRGDYIQVTITEFLKSRSLVFSLIFTRIQREGRSRDYIPYYILLTKAP